MSAVSGSHADARDQFDAGQLSTLRAFGRRIQCRQHFEHIINKVRFMYTRPGSEQRINSLCLARS